MRQTLTELELIVVNDASTDDSAEIIQHYAQTDSRLVCITNAHTLGRGQVRNSGLRVARGRYIAILDCDDIAMPFRLERQAGFLDSNPDVFLVGSGAFKIDGQGRSIGRHYPITNRGRLARKLVKRNRIYHSTVMYRSGQYYYRDKMVYAQDYDLFLRMLSDGQSLAMIGEPLIQYRINNQAVSQTNAGKQKLFAEQAALFYRQRRVTGSDEYHLFDPKTILQINPAKSNHPSVMRAEIESCYRQRKYAGTRSACRRYFRNYGWANKYLWLYLISLPR